MSKTLRRNLILSTIAVGLLVAGSATPAFAWGGPSNFNYNGNNCSKYSIANNSAGNAGANTVLTLGSGPVKVGFHGSGHAWINPVSGAGTAVSFISQSVVSLYLVSGGTHQCNASGNFYS